MKGRQRETEKERGGGGKIERENYNHLAKEFMLTELMQFTPVKMCCAHIGDITFTTCINQIASQH